MQKWIYAFQIRSYDCHEPLCAKNSLSLWVWIKTRQYYTFPPILRFVTLKPEKYFIGNTLEWWINPSMWKMHQIKFLCIWNMGFIQMINCLCPMKRKSSHFPLSRSSDHYNFISTASFNNKLFLKVLSHWGISIATENR